MRSTMISATILLISLVVAWMRWTTEPDKIAPNSILVMTGEITDIESISWKTEDESLLLEHKDDDNGKYLWVTHRSTKGESEIVKQFKAGKNGDSLLEALSPLTAVRKLEVNDDAKKAELGLDTPSITLTVARKGSTREFQLGAEAYGTKDYYVFDRSGSEYFLIDDKKFNHLKRGRTTLPDRSLWSKKSTEATSMTITQGKKSLDAEHKNHQDKSSSKWINRNAPEADNAQLETWIGKALKLSASRYQNDEDPLDKLVPAFNITLGWEQHPKQTAAFSKLDESWWAQSSHTRAWVKINSSAIKELVADLDSLFVTDSSSE